MITVRQIQRLWDERKYGRLVNELLAARIESSPRIASRFNNATAAAAWALIRLDELGQAQAPLTQSLLRCLIASQGTDGGWNDPLLCAICLRALTTSNGQGVAIERGMEFLATLQKPEGIWPDDSVRRMPADAFGSAFILLQVGTSRRFAETSRLSDAIRWFQKNLPNLDGETGKLWDHASLKIGAAATRPAEPVFNWS